MNKKKSATTRILRYYAPYKTMAFTVIAKDDKGKPISVKDGRGEPRYSKGMPVYQEIGLTFRPQISVRTNSSEPLSYFELEVTEKDGELLVADKNGVRGVDLYAALEKLADDPSTKVEREDAYRQKVNPQAFAVEKELEAARERIAELEEKRPSMGDDAIQEMLRENAQLKKELESFDKLTAPSGKLGHSQGGGKA